MGSSPHARGARCLRRDREHRRGIIPACAGSTSLTCFRVMTRRDHPRMRGEHKYYIIKTMRRAGIIPACAGSTTARAGIWFARRDHPRMRGEHLQRVTRVCGVPGSSPHARGARNGHIKTDGSAGIIPACAGSTVFNQTLHFLFRDHPRMRGEHFLSRNVSNPSKGSSPHARGAPGILRER